MRLIADNLACDRGGRRVFAGVRLSLESGAALVVTGPNGVGKSSLLRVLAGLVQPAAGRVAIEDGDREATPGEHCHYSGHLDALKPALSVAENLLFWRSFLSVPAAPASPGLAPCDPDTALERVGIGHVADLPAAYLSAGQRRRLALARLLVTARPVWLLDEPTAALDTASEETLTGLMRAHVKAGGMIVAATHQPLDLGPDPDLVATLHLEAAT